MVGFDWRNCMYIIPRVNLYNSYKFLATKTTNELQYLFIKNTVSKSRKGIILGNYYSHKKSGWIHHQLQVGSIIHTTLDLHY